MNSSQGNEIGTEYHLSETVLCVNGCGFFGTAAMNGLCSKCYRDSRIEEERAASARSAVEKFIGVQDNRSGDVTQENAPAAAAESSVEAVAISNRCSSCKKRVGVVGFQCRCGCTFCGVHRYPEKHSCTFDFKAVGKDAIARANPVIKADKIDRI